MQKINRLFIICGEPSGELHAAALAGALKNADPGLKITGVGGKLLAGAGAEVFYDIRGLAVMGLFDVLKKLPQFLSLKKLNPTPTMAMAAPEKKAIFQPVMKAGSMPA